MKSEMNRRPSESGSAFVISILILFVLSVLGMALMLTTTAETDISVNYRWGEMAFFNADAALEYGKNVLAAYAVGEGDLLNALPEARTVVQVTCGAAWGDAIPNDPPLGAPSCGDPTTAGCRDYQYFIDSPNSSGLCTRTYIGRVLRDLNDQPIQYDFRQPVAGDARGDIDNDGFADMEGTATIWIRRPIDGTQDYIGNDRAILTAEGTAPNYDYAPGTSRPGSLRRLEMTVTLGDIGITGDRYTDVTRASETDATIEQEGWRTVSRIQ